MFCSGKKPYTALLFGCAALISHVISWAGTPAPGEIDLSPALKIGDYTVSRYSFEKAHRQFVSPPARQTTSKTPEEIERWFRLYLAQQVIKADLARDKQLSRPDIIDMTERMARYMLTQPRGPLYSFLAKDGKDIGSFRRERRAQILKEREFSASPENLVRLWSALAPAFQRGALPSESDLGDFASTAVAAYTVDGQGRQISASDFVRDFRQGIARPAPHDEKMLAQQVEDIVVADYDLAEAKRLQIDKTPQFVEDQRNFALNQALALYEQEVLAQKVSVSRDEKMAAYQSNLDRYTSPQEIVGALQIYSNRTTAQQALYSSGGDVKLDETTAPEKVVDPFVVRRDGRSAFTGAPYSFLLAVPIGRSCGPFDYQGKHAVFIKHSLGILTPRPFEDVEPEIQRQLARQKIEALELERLNREISRVELYIDLGGYGLPKLAGLAVAH